MRHLLFRARALLSGYFALVMTYRAEMFFWALSGMLPLIMAGVWTTAAADGQMAMPAGEYALYFYCIFIVRQMTIVWVVYEFESHVVHGQLSHFLLQPMDPGWRYFAEHIVERLMRLPMVLLIGVLFFVLFPQSFSTWRLTAESVGAAALATVAAFVMRYCAQYMLAMFAFWVERAHAIDDLFYLPLLFLSGLIAPLDDFPPMLRDVLMYTPFPYMVYFPAKILMGGEVDVMRGVLVTASWAVAFFLLQRLLWRRGLKHYSGMGA